MSILHLAKPSRKSCVAAPLSVLVGLSATEVPSVPAIPSNPVIVSLPVLPPPHVRYPGLFDETGCALLAVAGGRKDRICPVLPITSEARSQSATEGGTWRKLLGFEGPHYATTVEGSGVEVLPSTLRIGPEREDEWAAVGMVRNGTRWVVDQIEVSAQLVSANGSSLETVTVWVPVRSVRPGEPAPFALKGTTPHSSVSSVRWTANFRRGNRADARARMVEFDPIRLVSISAPLPFAVEDASVLGSPPLAAAVPRQIAWGTLRNLSPRPIRKPSVVGMWIDAKGRAVSLVQSGVLKPSPGPASSAIALRRGEMGQFAVAVPSVALSSIPQRGLRLALWETAS